MTAELGVTPEKYALSILRRHRDAMSRPDFQNIADDAALSAREVEALWEQLLAGRTTKPDYRSPGRVQPSQTLDRPRVAHAPSPPGQNADPRPVETPPAWRAAADHPNAKVRRAVAKAIAAVEVVEQLLAAEARKDELRKKEARLAAQLAAVRAEIRGKAPAKADPGESSEKVPCPECGDLVNSHRLPQHRNRSAKHQAADQ